MTIETMQLMLLDDRTCCSAQHLVEVSGLSPDELEALVDSGVIVPVESMASPAPVTAAQPAAAAPQQTARTTQFHLHYLVTATLARRLRDDFELDDHGLILALTLLRRIQETEAELAAARAQLARVLPNA